MSFRCLLIAFPFLASCIGCYSNYRVSKTEILRLGKLNPGIQSIELFSDEGELVEVSTATRYTVFRIEPLQPVRLDLVSILADGGGIRGIPVRGSKEPIVVPMEKIDFVEVRKYNKKTTGYVVLGAVGLVLLAALGCGVFFGVIVK